MVTNTRPRVPHRDGSSRIDWPHGLTPRMQIALVCVLTAAFVTLAVLGWGK